MNQNQNAKQTGTKIQTNRAKEQGFNSFELVEEQGEWIEGKESKGAIDNV